MEIIYWYCFLMSCSFNFCYMHKSIHCFYCITFTQLNCCYPSLLLYINRMVCCCFKFLLSISPYMINCMGCCAEGFNYFFKICFSCFFISGINFITFAYFIYKFMYLTGIKWITPEYFFIIKLLYILTLFFY